eukprot:4389211-Prymnesium_polylepis.1
MVPRRAPEPRAVPHSARSSPVLSGRRSDDHHTSQCCERIEVAHEGGGIGREVGRLRCSDTPPIRLPAIVPRPDVHDDHVRQSSFVAAHDLCQPRSLVDIHQLVRDVKAWRCPRSHRPRAACVPVRVAGQRAEQLAGD